MFVVTGLTVLRGVLVVVVGMLILAPLPLAVTVSAASIEWTQKDDNMPPVRSIPNIIRPIKRGMLFISSDPEFSLTSVYERCVVDKGCITLQNPSWRKYSA